MQLLHRRLGTYAPSSLCNKINTKLFILILLQIHVFGVKGERICHHCRGINCQRTSYEAIEKCSNNLDICVNVFNGQTIQAQGCLEQLPQDLRIKCSSSEDNAPLSECYKCNTNLCNNLASSSFECIQCDSNTDANCRSNSSSLKPSRCQISRSPREYCFVKQDGNRVIRGCSLTVAEQRSCLSAVGCMICQPSELSGCNMIDIDTEDSGSSEGSGSGSDGDGSGSDSGGGGSEGSGSGSDGGGSQGSGSGSGSDSGSSSGGAGSGSGSDGGDSQGSGSGSGSDSGSSSGGAGSGSGSDGGDSQGSGNGSGTNGLSSSHVKFFICIVNIYITYLWRKIIK